MARKDDQHPPPGATPFPLRSASPAEEGPAQFRWRGFLSFCLTGPRSVAPVDGYGERSGVARSASRHSPVSVWQRGPRNSIRDVEPRRASAGPASQGLPLGRNPPQGMMEQLLIDHPKNGAR